MILTQLKIIIIIIIIVTKVPKSILLTQKLIIQIFFRYVSTLKFQNNYLINSLK